MSAVLNSIADKLRKARALIERGWCKGRMFSDGCVCIRGAIIITFSGDDESEDGWAAERRANTLLQKATGFNGYLGVWNDAPARTKTEVLAAFDKAIELAEAERKAA